MEKELMNNTKKMCRLIDALNEHLAPYRTIRPNRKRSFVTRKVSSKDKWILSIVK